jgi:hypothetical protein
MAVPLIIVLSKTNNITIFGNCFYRQSKAL